MGHFEPIKNRDAYPAIRGFGYQIDLTIQRWLVLTDGQALALECGEDIDTVNLAAMSGSSKVFDRMVEQVKHRTKKITLISPEALTSIANFRQHQASNPGLSLGFRFATNAMPTREKRSPYDDRRPAIEAWEDIRQGRLADDEELRRLAGIRTVLNDANKPDGLNQVIWDQFTTFLTQASVEELREFVRCFEWGTGEPNAEKLSQEVVASLLELGHATDADQAQSLYARLFLFVAKVLSHSGKKMLVPQDLLDQVQGPPLTSQDAARLQLIEREILGLRNRVEALEGGMARQQDIADQQQRDITRLSQEVFGQDISGQAIASLEDYADSVPPAVALLSRRQLAVAALSSSFPESTWLALHAGVGWGKSQLCILLSKSLSDHSLWLLLRDLSDEAAAVKIESVIRHCLSRGGDDQQAGPLAFNIVVLDDLPKIDPDGLLGRRVCELAQVCRDNGLRLLSSSHHLIPQDFLDRMPDGACTDLACPQFSLDETKELFNAYGAKADDLTTIQVQTLNLKAHGHPTILASIARYLRDRNWRLSDQELEYVKASTTVDINATFSRLLETVQSEDNRGFLYRLSLIMGYFGLEQAQIVSEAEPSLGKPRERLASLSGLWVEEQGSGLMMVTPLAKTLGESEVPVDVRRSVLTDLGDESFLRPKRSVIDVARAVSYYDQAEAYDKAVAALILALIASEALPDYELALLLSFSWATESTPPAARLGPRILLRAQQVNALARLGKSVDYVLADAQELMQEATEDDHWAVVSFSIVVSQRIAETDFALSMKLIRTAFDSYRVAASADSPLIPLPEEFHPIQLLWLASINAKTPDDLRSWITMFGELSDDAGDRAFGEMMDEENALPIIGKLWQTEAEKPTSERRWPDMLAVYGQIASLADGLGLELFWAMAVRCQVVILAEYMDQLDDALKCATAALDRADLSPSVLFLLKDIIGRQFVYKKRPRDAVPWLTDALVEETSAFPRVRSRTHLELAGCVGKDNPHKAVRLAEQAVVLAKDAAWLANNATRRLSAGHTPDLDGHVPPDAIGNKLLWPQAGVPKSGTLGKAEQNRLEEDLQPIIALGELAIARWLVEDNSGAFDALDEAAEILIFQQNESTGWKGCVIVLGHVVANMITSTGPVELPAEPSVDEAVSRGMFLCVGAAPTELLDDHRRHFFYPMLVSFAEAVGNDERCEYWAIKGMAVAREAGVIDAIAMIGRGVLPSLLLAGKYVDAISITIECYTAMYASTASRKSGDQALQTGVVASDVLGPKTNSVWRDIEISCLIHGLLPVVARLCHVKLKSSEDAAAHAIEVCDLCDQIAETAACPKMWQEVSELIRLAFVDSASHKDIHERANHAAENGSTALQTIAYLVESVTPDVPLTAAVLCQAVTCQYAAAELATASTVYRRVILPFLADYWRDAVARERFRIRSPATVETSLEEAIQRPADEQAQAIFRAIIGGLRLQLPDNLDKVHEWLYPVP